MNAPSHKDIRQQVCLQGVQHERLSMLARARGISQSELVRRLIDAAWAAEGYAPAPTQPARPECRHGVALDRFCSHCEALAATVEIDPVLSSLVDRHIANSPYPLPAHVR